MAIQNTPGIWEDIPTGAVVTATCKGQTITGTLQEVYRSGTGAHKCMEIVAPPLGVITLDARDHWEVTYATETVADVLAKSPVGTVLRSNTTQIVKVSKFNVTREDLEASGYDVPPLLLRITEFEKISSAPYRKIALS